MARSKVTYETYPEAFRIGATLKTSVLFRNRPEPYLPRLVDDTEGIGHSPGSIKTAIAVSERSAHKRLDGVGHGLVRYRPRVRRVSLQDRQRHGRTPERPVGCCSLPSGTSLPSMF